MEITIFVIATVICLAFTSFGDLRDRMIYTAPIIALHVLWALYIWAGGIYAEHFLIAFWSAQLVLYISLNCMNVWGGGDSDLYMLLGDICLLACNGASPEVVGITICISLALSLVIAILIGKIEFCHKGEALQRDSSLAVAPGLAVVMTVLLAKAWTGMVIV